MTQERNKWGAAVNVVMNLLVPLSASQGPHCLWLVISDIYEEPSYQAYMASSTEYQLSPSQNTAATVSAATRQYVVLQGLLPASAAVLAVSSHLVLTDFTSLPRPDVQNKFRENQSSNSNVTARYCVASHTEPDVCQREPANCWSRDEGS